MSNAIYLDQSARALQLTLLEDLDVAQFSILAEEVQTFQGDIQIKAAIIGASHCLCYSCGDVRLWEVFACTPVEGRTVAFVGPLERIQGRFQLQFGAHQYAFQAQALSWQQGFDRVEALQNAVEHPVEDQIQLSHCFPRGDFDHAPCTIIRVKNGHNAVCIETVHSYPNEAQIVFTNSEFSWRGYS